MLNFIILVVVFAALAYCVKVAMDWFNKERK